MPSKIRMLTGAETGFHDGRVAAVQNKQPPPRVVQRTYSPPSPSPSPLSTFLHIHHSNFSSVGETEGETEREYGRKRQVLIINVSRLPTPGEMEPEYIYIYRSTTQPLSAGRRTAPGACPGRTSTWPAPATTSPGSSASSSPSPGRPAARSGPWRTAWRRATPTAARSLQSSLCTP